MQIAVDALTHSKRSENSVQIDGCRYWWNWNAIVEESEI